MNYVTTLASSLLGQKRRHQKSPDEELRETMLPMTVLADETFGMSDFDAFESFFEAANNQNLHEETGVQLQLPLEDPRQVQAHYLHMIRRYEQAYERMAGFALKWHSLITDVNTDPTVKKMFNDMQIIRKLTGDSMI